MPLDSQGFFRGLEVVTFLWVGFVAYGTSRAGFGIGMMVATGLPWLALAILWGACLLSVERRRVSGAKGWLWTYSAATIAALVLVTLSLPLVLRIQWHEEELLRVCESIRLQEAEVKYTLEGEVFDFEYGVRCKDAVFLCAGWDLLLRDFGLVHSPAGPPPSAYSGYAVKVRHLFGPWWSYSCRVSFF
jgi:hypothetical protein